MKCSEAVEWMHRYLDHDLNEEESSQLFEHIRSCRDCAEEFEILNRLNSRLEQLPKVTPKISLVDSILPQLEEIDRARREEGSASEMIPDREPLVAKSDESASRSRRQSPWRNRAFRFGTMGVTAALVLGIFIYNYQPRTMSDAEMVAQSLSSSNDQEQSSANTDSPNADEGIKSELSPPTGDQPAEGSLNDQDNAAKPGGDAGKGDANTAGDGDGDTAIGQERNATPKASKPDSAGAKDAKGGKTPAVTKSGQTGNQQKDGSNQSKQGQTPASGGNATDPAADSNSSNRSFDGAVADSVEVGGLEDNRFKADVKGIIGFMAFDPWTSPDGGFTVEVNEGHLYLYQNHSDSGDSRKLIADTEFDGTWVQGNWSEDGTEFQYEIEKDGVTSAYTMQTNADSGADASENTDHAPKNK